MAQHLEKMIYTAKHELSHAMVGYALRCQNIIVRVYKVGQKERARVAAVGRAAAKEVDVKCMGFFQASYPKRHYSIFVSCGPFGSPLYNPSEDDFLEFQGLVARYRRMTKKPVTTFTNFVLEPVKLLLGCEPMTAIVQRIAPVLAQGGRITAKNWKDLEKFFPADLNRPMLEAMCQQVRAAANDYPFDDL